ncbi:MAG: hypothetical protein CYPHOPRED_005650 [Cyphobasidiales sp. Tagirdzhanova-0007]|nr:MAG: hypothetical protein CYPHOPRED_005650 [Cyphobasidiales sp. Tagirdzhanova-0007]
MATVNKTPKSLRLPLQKYSYRPPELVVPGSAQERDKKWSYQLGTEGHLFLDMGYSMDDTYELKITAADQLVRHLDLSAFSPLSHIGSSLPIIPSTVFASDQSRFQKLCNRFQIKLSSELEVLQIVDALRSYIDQAPDGTSIIIKTNPERPKKQTNSGEDESQGTFLQTQTNMLPCPQSILTANVSRHHRPNTECNSGLGSHAALHDKRPIILTPTLTEGAAPATFSTTQTLLELPIFKSPRPDTPMPPRATETSDPAGRTPFMQNTEQLIHHDNSMTAAQDFNIQTDLHRYMLSQPETQQTQQAYMTDTDGLEASIKVVDAEQTQFSPSIVQRTAIRSEYQLDQTISQQTVVHPTEQIIAPVLPAQNNDASSAHLNVPMPDNSTTCTAASVDIMRVASHPVRLFTDESGKEHGLLGECKLSAAEEEELLKEIMMEVDWVQFVERVAKLPAGLRVSA